MAEGCVSVRSSHGYILERGETSLTARTGLDTKESVLAKYGEPSVKSTFSDDAWYYVSNKDQARAFFRPELTDQTVIAFLFDGDGTVKEVKELGLGDSVNVAMSNQKTRTRGKELTFLEQLLGNVGRLPAGGAGIGPQGPQR